MNRFNHGRVMFAGTLRIRYHPFGAQCPTAACRTDNLVWKLTLVIDGKAPEALLDTYSDERCWAADENIMNSTARPTSSRQRAMPANRLHGGTAGAKACFRAQPGELGATVGAAFYTGSVLNTPTATASAA